MVCKNLQKTPWYTVRKLEYTTFLSLSHTHAHIQWPSDSTTKTVTSSNPTCTTLSSRLSAWRLMVPKKKQGLAEEHSKDDEVWWLGGRGEKRVVVGGERRDPDFQRAAKPHFFRHREWRTCEYLNWIHVWFAHVRFGHCGCPDRLTTPQVGCAAEKYVRHISSLEGLTHVKMWYSWFHASSYWYISTNSVFAFAAHRPILTMQNYDKAPLLSWNFLANIDVKQTTSTFALLYVCIQNCHCTRLDLLLCVNCAYKHYF